jgi:hypothetical protein
MTAFNEFSAIARRWAQFYRMRETTYIAVRIGDSWYLLYSRELFHSDEPPIGTPPLHIRTPSIRAGQFRTKLDERNASEIMEGALAERGKVTVGEWSVGLSDNATLNNRFDRLYPMRAPGQMRLPTYIMESGCVDLKNSKDALALELMACDTPYENLEELCLDKLGNPPALPG